MGDLDGEAGADITSGRYAYFNPGGDMTAPWRRVDLDRNVDAVLILDVDTAVNLERGYKPLAIYSPREVASDEEEDH